MTNSKYKSIWQLLSTNDFKEEIPEEFHCVICKKVTIVPFAALCECRFCFRCIKEYLSNRNQVCPGGKNECMKECLVLEDNVTKDQIAIRSIMKCVVKCRSRLCDVECEIEQMVDHLLVCGMSFTKCPYHILGCEEERETMEDVKKHCDDESIKHAQLLVVVIDHLGNDIVGLRKVVERKDEEITNLKENYERNEVHMEHQNSKLGELQNEMEMMREELRMMREVENKKYGSIPDYGIIERQTESPNNQEVESEFDVENVLRLWNSSGESSTSRISASKIVSKEFMRNPKMVEDFYDAKTLVILAEIFFHLQDDLLAATKKACKKAVCDKELNAFDHTNDPRVLMKLADKYSNINNEVALKETCAKAVKDEELDAFRGNKNLKSIVHLADEFIFENKSVIPQENHSSIIRRNLKVFDQTDNPKILMKLADEYSLANKMIAQKPTVAKHIPDEAPNSLVYNKVLTNMTRLADESIISKNLSELREVCAKAFKRDVKVWQLSDDPAVTIHFVPMLNDVSTYFSTYWNTFISGKLRNLGRKGFQDIVNTLDTAQKKSILGTLLSSTRISWNGLAAFFCDSDIEDTVRILKARIQEITESVTTVNPNTKSLVLCLAINIITGKETMDDKTNKMHKSSKYYEQSLSNDLILELIFDAECNNFILK